LNLENSKKISVDVANKVQIAKETEVKINVSSELYRGAAERGALVYFLLNDLNRIHTFYKFSLESFIVVVNRSIDLISEKKGDNTNKDTEGKKDEDEKVED
jgi:dynein heavy chain